MNNSKFKELLKETITQGAASLFEDEEVAAAFAEDETEEVVSDEDFNSASKTLETELEKKLTDAAAMIAKIKSDNNISAESFSQILAYYFLGMYHDEEEEWGQTLSSKNIFNTNLKGILTFHEKNRKNIVCSYDEALDWLLKYPAYQSPSLWIRSLRTRNDQTLLKKLASTLKKIETKAYPLSTENSAILKKLIARLPADFKITNCPAGGTPAEPEKTKTRTKKQQPMSLDSLEQLIKSTEAKNYASQISAALKKDIKDLRVKIDEATEKTPLLTNTIKVLQSITDEKIQQIALKSVLDFFRKNNLQINNQTRFALTKAGILRRKGNKKQEPGKENQSEKQASEEENEEDEEESGLTRALDKIQSGLDVAGAAGLIPVLAPIATPASIASLILNLSRGKFGWALFDLITLVPVVGGAAKAGKLGKGAQAAAAAAKWKGGKALIKTLGSAKAAKKGIDSVKATNAAIQASKGTKGAAELIGDMIPYKLWSQIENAEIPDVIRKNLDEEDRDKPLIDFVLDTLGNLDIPVLDGKIEGLRDAWRVAKISVSPERKSPEKGGAGYDFMRENLNLNEQRYNRLIKRFNIK